MLYVKMENMKELQIEKEMIRVITNYSDTIFIVALLHKKC